MCLLEYIFLIRPTNECNIYPDYVGEFWFIILKCVFPWGWTCKICSRPQPCHTQTVLSHATDGNHIHWSSYITLFTVGIGNWSGFLAECDVQIYNSLPFISCLAFGYSTKITDFTSILRAVCENEQIIQQSSFCSSIYHLNITRSFGFTP